MNQAGISALVCLGAGLLLAGLAPMALRGQTENPRTVGSLPPGGPGRVSGQTLEIQCETFEASAEQIARDARIWQQNLQERLAGLQKQIADENFMSSEEVAKLRAMGEEFSKERNTFESRAVEWGAKAHAFTAQAEKQAEEIRKQVEMGIAGMPGIESGTEEGSGWLGVEIGEVTADNAKEWKLPAVRGVVVQAVDLNGPAAKAGLQEKDVITQYDGQVVEGTLQFRRLVRETPSGRSVTLGILRGGKSQSLTVILGDRGALAETRSGGPMAELGNSFSFSGPDGGYFAFNPENMDRTTPRLGIEAEDLSGQLGAYFGAPGNTGILVREVREGSAGEKAGLKAGDVITEIDGKPVHRLTELREELRHKEDQKNVSLHVLRKGTALNLSVAIEKPDPPSSSRLIRRAQM
jgi:serine protease Do